VENYPYMKTQILIFFLVFSCLNLLSQEKFDSIQKTKTDFPISLSKNIVSLDASFLYVGMFGGYGASFNFERLIFGNKTSDNFYIKAGLGYYLIGGSDTELIGFDLPLSLVFLSGKNHNHFEADIGFRTIFVNKNEKHSLLIANIGYRYQHPGNGILFKALAGVDGLTLGFGYAF